MTSNPRATIPAGLPRPQRTKHNYGLVFGALAACLVIGAIVAGRAILSDRSEPTTPPAAPQPAAQHSTPVAPEALPKTGPPPDKQVSSLVDDDGKTLWASPTNGKPLDLAYLPPGAQVMISIRPAALVKHAESEKILGAFEPIGQQAVEYIEHATTVALSDMERLVVGCQATSEGKWQATLVVYASRPIAGESLAAKLPGAREKEHAGKKYWVANERAYYFPDSSANKVLVIGPEDALRDVIDLAGQPPPLRRDIERLIAHTDSDRQLTIVFAPNTLFSQGQNIFVGELAPLRDPLFWFLGDELSGAALSVHLDENFFLELIATPTLETSPEKAARLLAERVAQIPDKLEAYVVSLNPQPYGRLVIARFPEMIRKLAAYTRSGFESDHAVLRCYLPAFAAHNLLLAVELTLAESSAALPHPPGEPASAGGKTAPTTSKSIKERLAKITSLKFTRDTLESALEQLSQDIGAPIIIRGPDLQADGITKNQSFGIDVSNKPAEEILIEILRLANPDKTATAPNDPRQKLVYIIEQKPDETEQIVVTTRARAAERHDDLPPAFRTK
jgi:hypothetical protein